VRPSRWRNRPEESCACQIEYFEWQFGGQETLFMSQPNDLTCTWWGRPKGKTNENKSASQLRGALYGRSLSINCNWRNKNIRTFCL
jgi:hypothetical protein